MLTPDQSKMTKNAASYSKESVLCADEYLHALLADIAAAKQTIDLETYIYNDDFFGMQIADALIKAAEKGVKVRLLVDGAGTSWNKCLERMERAGVIIRFFHPFPWNVWQRQRTNFPSSIFFNTIYLFSQINARNHRKSCLIDNKIVYVGSVNISQIHLSTRFGGGNWCDSVIRLHDINTIDLQYAFDIAWHGFPINERIIKSFQKADPNPYFRLNYSRHHRRVLFKFLLKKILAAKERIWIMSAYFNPNYFLLKALTRAAKKGIDVKIILTHHSDIIFMPMVAQMFYKKLLNAGIEIYEFLPSVLHSKIIMVDDWFCVGSSNFNQRSLRHDLELDVNIQTPEAKKMLEKNFIENIKLSEKVELSDFEKQKQPFYKRIFSQVLLYLNYFL